MTLPDRRRYVDVGEPPLGHGMTKFPLAHGFGACAAAVFDARTTQSVVDPAIADIRRDVFVVFAIPAVSR